MGLKSSSPSMPGVSDLPASVACHMALVGMLAVPEPTSVVVLGMDARHALCH